MTTSSQFLVEIVSTILLRKGESGPPCGVPSSTGRTKPSSNTPASRNARISENAFIGYRCGDARHQDVVVNSVEKSFQIEINHYVVAIGDVTLCLGYSLVGGPPWPKSETVLQNVGSHRSWRTCSTAC